MRAVTRWNRRAEQREPHGAPSAQQPGQILDAKSVEARPQGDVRGRGVLGLQTDQLLQHRRSALGQPREQTLPREQRPVQGPRAKPRRV
jgi:hypothetical protein